MGWLAETGKGGYSRPTLSLYVFEIDDVIVKLGNSFKTYRLIEVQSTPVMSDHSQTNLFAALCQEFPYTRKHIMAVAFSLVLREDANTTFNESQGVP
ncbi:hypothetical protein M4D70_06215 [Brevibacillus borstelensis]|nr:hypothetical protein [Brevibacillus borstelensis]MCM3557167.1 hypothetical protein [Brevibacillus borstelensis]MCM3590841.1 hypothetical protein [Brevibacillus borstelensis]MCM3621854.1 hypothetical protein [Brevibacillus borstelensis]MED1742383.1 hypothetical protein [Brevibacillus borstelensis]